MVRFQHRGRSEKLGRSCPSALWAALIAAFTIGERQVISSAPAVARNFGPVFTLPAIGPENPISMSATTKRRGSASASDPRKLGFVRLLGPGLITGASDDDPSGIATYSQAGAQFGFAISWTMLFTYPRWWRFSRSAPELAGRRVRVSLGIAPALPKLGSASDCRSAFHCKHNQYRCRSRCDGRRFRIADGRTDTGLRDRFRVIECDPSDLHGVFPVRYRSKMVDPCPIRLFRHRYGRQIPWGEAARGLLLLTFFPHVAFWTTVVAVLGTTISPYLFFWQAAQEVEDIRVEPQRKPP